MRPVVSESPPREKDPRRVQAGKAGMLARWGPGPAVVRLRDLDPYTQDIIRAILAARANAAENAKAAPAIVTPEAAQEVRRAAGEPSAA